MDKETLSNYGWIVICTLVLAVMIALATPFGQFVSDGIWSITNGFNDTLNKNLSIGGLYVNNVSNVSLDDFYTKSSVLSLKNVENGFEIAKKGASWYPCAILKLPVNSGFEYNLSFDFSELSLGTTSCYVVVELCSAEPIASTNDYEYPSNIIERVCAFRGGTSVPQSVNYNLPISSVNTDYYLVVIIKNSTPSFYGGVIINNFSFNSINS